MPAVMSTEADGKAPEGPQEHGLNAARAHVLDAQTVRDLETEVGSRPTSFTTLKKDFGIDSHDRPDLHADPIAPGRRRILLLACICILGNELCERLAYYGLQTNMGLYLKKVLGYPADEASQLLQVWKATVYLTPLIGAYLADAVIGRFWVILVFSCIYFVGMLGITLTNLIPSVRPSKTELPPAGIDTTRAMFWAFMYLVALGSGGIKPCVSSFGGDQFRENSVRERAWRSSFFNYFYASINIGSLVASTVVVGVQENQGYGIGFGIPTIAFAVAIIAFIVGALFKLYVKVPPEGSPFGRIWAVLKGAFRNRKQPAPTTPAELFEPVPGTKGALPYTMEYTPRMKFLDKAALPGKAGTTEHHNHGHDHDHHGTKEHHGHHAVSRTQVEETKAFIGIMPLFLCICIYQMAYDPIFTLLPYPGDVMDRSIGNSSTQIPASSISFANTFGVLFAVVIYDLVIVKITNRIGRPISMTMRIGLGFFIQILALVSAAIIEMVRYRVVHNVGLVDAFNAAGPDADPLDPQFIQPMSIWWQFIPYFLVGVSEVFTNIGTMELFYTQVSEGMRSLGTSVYLLTIAIGTYLASALNKIVAAASPVDLWVADNPLFGHYDWYLWLNAAILVVGLIIYYFVARKYTEKPILSSDDDPFKRENRLHAEVGNVARAWPSVSADSRMSDLRMRSVVSNVSRASVRSAGSAGKRMDVGM